MHPSRHARTHPHKPAFVMAGTIYFAAELPRHPTGKLYKRLLRDRYWAGRASKII